MKRIIVCLALFTLMAFGFLATPRSGHSQQDQLIDYPPEFSPLRTWRPAKTQPSLTPQTKFVKAERAIPNHYIVVLNDDVVPDDSPREVRKERIAAIANSHARAHLGTIGFIYETALKGYSIELPNEAAARAISKSPRVKWVEEDSLLEPTQAPPSPQSSPPWGLDAVDGSMPTAAPGGNGRNNGLYIFNANGSNVRAYVLDTGINTAHQDFSTGFNSRAVQAGNCVEHADCIQGPQSPFTDSFCVFPMPNSTNNDCFGHGTHVAGTLGGNIFGVAKNVQIRSVKVCTVSFGCPDSVSIAGVNFVTNEHNANPTIPAVANISFGGPTSFPVNPPFTDPPGLINAVNNSINSGVTYVIAAGNNNGNASNTYPANVAAALTVGAVDWNGNRWVFSGTLGSNWGPGVDLFAPGVQIVSALTGNFMPCAWNGTNNTECQDSGTSYAAPHVAGAVAMYLQGRSGVTGCSVFPIQGIAPPSANLSTCPDRVTRYIKANANLSRLTSTINVVIGQDPQGHPITVFSPNRFVWNVGIPGPANPIDNQRFFVWSHYADFLTAQPEPDEGGLNFWTGQITNNCGTGFNDNNACTHTKRIDVSRAFWVAAFGSLFNAQGTTNNSEFVRKCYEVYLRRTVPINDPGFLFWLNDLSANYGNPANFDGVNHLIDAFLGSTEYRHRFGP
jgi:subtilisin family serine protease